MRMRRLKGWPMAGALTIALTGCTVEQTEEARAPDVDLDVDPGRPPQYEINWADVDVGTTERTVTVPVVRVEQERREVSVPYIDINVPDSGDERDERTVTVEVDVPHAGYALRIDEIRAAGDTLWVVASLEQTGSPAAQVVTRVSDQVVVNAPRDLDVRKVIVGQRPQGVYNQQHRFVDSRAAVDAQMPAGARVIYQRR